MENGNLKVDEQYKVTLPPNLITVLEYDKKDFEGATLKNLIDDVECELSDWEIELYDDPHFYGYDEDEEGMSGSLLIGRKKPLCWRGDTRK